MDIYKLEPPADTTLKDITDLLALLQPLIDQKLYLQAPDNVKRLFKPSIYGASPSHSLN